MARNRLEEQSRADPAIAAADTEADSGEIAGKTDGRTSRLMPKKIMRESGIKAAGRSNAAANEASVPNKATDEGKKEMQARRRHRRPGVSKACRRCRRRRLVYALRFGTKLPFAEPGMPAAPMQIGGDQPRADGAGTGRRRAALPLPTTVHVGPDRAVAPAVATGSRASSAVHGGRRLHIARS